MTEHRTGTEASDAYGGYSGDRSSAAAKILASAREALDRADLARDPLGWAEAQYGYGNALGSQLQMLPAERFDGALRAYQAARDLWDVIGTDAQRAKGWVATGNAWKNLVTGVRSDNLEMAIHDHLEALTWARSADDDILLANAHNGLATAYTYRETGDRASNLETAVEHQERAIALYQRTGHTDRVVISWVSVGLAWSKHPDTEAGLERANAAYVAATEALGAHVLPPPHMRRLGSSAGFTAMRRADWDTAVRMYRIAYDATDALLEGAETHASRAHELAEHGSITARLASALVLSGDPMAAAALIESARCRALREPPEHEREVQVADDPWAGLERGESICYVASSVAGTASVLLKGGPSVSAVGHVTPNPTLDEIQDAVGIPPIFPGHGRALAAQLLPAAGLNRDLPKRILDLIDSSVRPPLVASLAAGDSESITLVPVDAVAELPVHIALLGDESETHLRGEVRLSYAPSAQLALKARERARSTSRREPFLVGVSITESESGPLPAAASELRSVARVFPGPSLLLDSENASLEAVMTALPRATHVHLACHGRFLHSSPQSSYFELAGGDRLTLGHISEHGLFSNARLVVATACDIGTTDALHWADASDGLASRMLADGMGALIAPIRPVYDVVAALFASRLYEELFVDGSEIRSTVAAARAQRWLRDLTGQELAAWLVEHPALLPELRRAKHGAGSSPLWADVPSLWAVFCHFGLA